MQHSAYVNLRAVR